MKEDTEIGKKNIAIAEMLGWQHFKSMHCFWENLIGERFVLLEFNSNANWQFKAIEWIEKQNHEVTIQGHRNWVRGQRVYIGNYRNDVFVKTDSEDKKEAIFEALFQFSQYLKEQEKTTGKMNDAIEFLRDKGYQVNDNGTIISDLPVGQEGLQLVDELEDATDCQFTITGNFIIATEA